MLCQSLSLAKSSGPVRSRKNGGWILELSRSQVKNRE